MKCRWASMTRPAVLALGLVLGPWAAQAQDAGSDAVQDWRQANATVGQYPRGHADVLRWEQAQPAADPVAAEPAPALVLATVSEAVRAAWAAHRELAPVLAQLDAPTQAQMAAGDWGALDVRLVRQRAGVDELLAVAATARKYWLTAVAARQTQRHLQDAVTAAQAAAELGRRMVAVGNWSRYQHIPLALAESSAQQALQRARLNALQAQWALLQALQLDAVHESVQVPEHLPDMPQPMVDEAHFQQRLHALQAQLSVVEHRKARHLALQAYAAYSASTAVHSSYQQDILPQQALLSEETLQRYNGMLESVWGLLGSAGARSQAVVAAIGAQRDALLAETDLQWVLHGGRPSAFVTLGTSETAPTATAGH